ncbi:MAG: hypothetical protein AB7O88_10705 [Reyranellaceae bacterium]
MTPPREVEPARALRAFDIAHVASAALAFGVPVLAFLGAKRDSHTLTVFALFALAGAAGAAIAGLLCRRWPGLSAPGWRLWLAAWLFNPILVLGLIYILSEYECVFGLRRGWGCLSPALVVLASPLTLIAPTVGVIAHVIARRSRPDSR